MQYIYYNFIFYLFFGRGFYLSVDVPDNDKTRQTESSSYQVFIHFGHH